MLRWRKLGQTSQSKFLDGQYSNYKVSEALSLRPYNCLVVVLASNDQLATTLFYSL